MPEKTEKNLASVLIVRSGNTVRHAPSPMLPTLIERAGEKASWRFPAILHRQHPQPEHPRGLRPGGGRIPARVRGQEHQAHRGRAAGACGGLYRGTGQTALGSDRQANLACIRMLLDWLVTGQVIATNPAHAVRGPRHSVMTGATTVMSSEDASAFLKSTGTSHVVGLRDRAIIAVMVYAFARCSAVWD